jgi:hypothetical protein
MPPKIDPSLYCTIGTAAQLAGVSRLWMRTQVQKGAVAGIEIDGQWFALRSSAAAFTRDPVGRGRPRDGAAPKKPRK